MKREGRIRGMVRTFSVLPAPVNPRPVARILNKLDSPPIAGIFVKAQGKPSNHSKFTGKCERDRCSDCHIHPVGKSKDKSKGTQKIRSSEAALNYKIVTWRIMSDRDPGLNRLPIASGYSASRMLDELDTNDDEEYEEYDEYDDRDDDHVGKSDDDDDDEVVEDNVGVVDCDDHEVVVDNVVGDYGVIDDDDDVMVYDVGVVWNDAGDDEGWTFVVPAGEF